MVRVGDAVADAAAPTLYMPPPPASAYRHAVALCAVARDEGVALAEWAAWHARLGITAAYVYDDGSDPPLASVVAAAEAAGRVPRGVVHVERLDPDVVARHPSHVPQMAAYDKCVADHRGDAAWLAFVDVDEFIVVDRDTRWRAPPSLPAMLDAYPSAGAVVLHWRVFGSGGWTTPPPRGVVASYTACVPTADPISIHVKTIARTAALAPMEPCLGPHHFAYVAGWYAVDVVGRRVDGPTSPHGATHTPLALHHYAVKSAAEFAAKAVRGSGMGNFKDVNWAADVDARATEVCDAAAKVAATG